MKLIHGSIVIYGRKIFEEELRSTPLPGCQNIVLSRSLAFTAGDSLTASSLPKALELAHNCEGQANIWILGGGQLYAEALPFASTLHLTEVHCEVEGDVYFTEEWRQHFKTVVAARTSSDEIYDYTFKEMAP
jgi:dihydrofolate reductase